jgi:cytochrome c-type biogenesis protein CcmH
MLADGRSETEIKQHFVDYYGARVLSEPPRTGFNWLIYVVPPIVIVAGIFVLFRALRAWSQTSEPEAGADQEDAPPPSDDEYIARMEAELKQRK